MVSFSKSSQEGSSRKVEEPTGRDDLSSQEGSSRNAVEEPTGRDDLSSQEGSYRNAVEEPSGRGDIEKCSGWSSLRADTSITVSETEPSRYAVEGSPQYFRVPGKPRNGAGSPHHIGKACTQPVTHRLSFRNSTNMIVLIFMMLSQVGFCRFMDEAQADALLQTLENDVGASKRFVEFFPDSKPVNSPDEILCGFYDSDNFDGANSVHIARKNAKVKLNICVGDGLCSAKTDDLGVYNVDIPSGNGETTSNVTVLTRKQGEWVWIIIPFMPNNKTLKLRLFSTMDEEHFDYTKSSKPVSERNGILLKDMYEAWLSNSKPRKSNRQYQRAMVLREGNWWICPDCSDGNYYLNKDELTLERISEENTLAKLPDNVTKASKNEFAQIACWKKKCKKTRPDRRNRILFGFREGMIDKRFESNGSLKRTQVKPARFRHTQ